MLLVPQDVALFFRLHRAFMFFVNQRLQVLPDQLATPDEYSGLTPDARLQVHKAWLEHPETTTEFVAENPFGFSKDELEIVASWKYRTSGDFYVFRQLKKYAVFLSVTEPMVAYGVIGLSEPIEDVVHFELPVLVKATLLPFRDQIIYDGLLLRYSIVLGHGIRRSLNDTYKAVKSEIITSLPSSTHPPRPKKSTKPKRRSLTLQQTPKSETADALAVITGLIDQFCKEHLNDEYAVVCRKLAEKLSRKRPSPLLQGKPNTWASGIVRTVGWINFLSDRSQAPSMRLSDIDHYFGIGESTGSAKSSAIRKLLKIHHYDYEWLLPSRMDDNLLVWMLMVNGIPMDIRNAPREAQEVAFEQGLIPYIPADRGE